MAKTAHVSSFLIKSSRQSCLVITNSVINLYLERDKFNKFKTATGYIKKWTRFKGL